MTEREALELALEALERSVATCFDQYAHQQVMSQPDHFINQTITAIKEVLAQPKREADIDLYSLLACNVEAGVFENQVAPILLDNGFGPQVIKENT